VCHSGKVRGKKEGTVKTFINCNDIEDFKKMGGTLKKVGEHLKMPAGVNIVIGIFSPGEGLKKHYHKNPTAELYYVYSGEGTVFLEGRKMKVTKGAALYIAPEKEHYIVNTGQQKLEVVFVLAPPLEGGTVILE